MNMFCKPWTGRGGTATGSPHQLEMSRRKEARGLGSLCQSVVRWVGCQWQNRIRLVDGGGVSPCRGLAPFGGWLQTGHRAVCNFSRAGGSYGGSGAAPALQHGWRHGRLGKGGLTTGGVAELGGGLGRCFSGHVQDALLSLVQLPCRDRQARVKRKKRSTSGRCPTTCFDNLGLGILIPCVVRFGFFSLE